MPGSSAIASTAVPSSTQLAYHHPNNGTPYSMDNNNTTTNNDNSSVQFVTPQLQLGSALPSPPTLFQHLAPATAASVPVMALSAAAAACDHNPCQYIPLLAADDDAAQQLHPQPHPLPSAANGDHLQNFIISSAAIPAPERRHDTSAVPRHVSGRNLVVVDPAVPPIATQTSKYADSSLLTFESTSVPNSSFSLGTSAGMIFPVGSLRPSTAGLHQHTPHHHNSSYTPPSISCRQCLYHSTTNSHFPAADSHLMSLNNEAGLAAADGGPPYRGYASQCQHFLREDVVYNDEDLFGGGEVCRVERSAEEKLFAAAAATAVVALSNVSLKASDLTPRWGAAAATLNQHVYVFGGYLWFHGIEGFFDDLLQIAPDASVIRRCLPVGGRPLPSGRFGHSLIADSVTQRLLLFGGRHSTETFQDVWSFYPSSQRWVLEPSNQSTSAVQLHNPRELPTPSQSNMNDTSASTSNLNNTTDDLAHTTTTQRLTQNIDGAARPPVESVAGSGASSIGLFDPSPQATTSAASPPQTSHRFLNRTSHGLLTPSASSGSCLPQHQHSGLASDASHHAEASLPASGHLANSTSHVVASLSDAHSSSGNPSAAAGGSGAATSQSAPVQDGAACSNTSLDISNSSPGRRSWHSAVVFNGGMFVFGGWNRSNTPYGDVWRYNLRDNLWCCVWSPREPAAPVVPSATTSDSFMGRGRTAGIVEPLDCTAAAESCTAAVAAPLPDSVAGGKSRSCHCAAVWGGEMYVFGGMGHGQAPLGDLEAFNLNSYRWRTVESRGAAPSRLISAAGTVVGEYWILHGGLTEYPKSGALATNNLYLYHFPTGVWQQRNLLISSDFTPSDTSSSSSPAAARYGHTAVVIPSFTSAPGSESATSGIPLQPMSDGVVAAATTEGYHHHSPSDGMEFAAFGPLHSVPDLNADLPQQQQHSYTASRTPPHSFAVYLIGGALKYATAATQPICRLDFCPSSAFATEVQRCLHATGLTVSSLSARADATAHAIVGIKSQTNFMSQSTKSDISDLRDKFDFLQSQIASLQQAVQSVQTQIGTVQHSLSSFEHFMPMMRNFGAAIANFGTWPPTQSSPVHKPQQVGASPPSGAMAHRA